MNYTLEEIYLLVGKEDKVAGLTFRNGSEAYKAYGNFITVVFIYTQYEREELDRKVKIEPFNLSGRIKARYSGIDLSEEQIENLLNIGINSDDIIDILYFVASPSNTFHSPKQRTIKKINIQLPLMARGKSIDWMYGFSKKQVNENIGLSPEERSFYLAGKYYFEADQLTNEEFEEIFISEAILNENVEWEFLSIKYLRKEITSQETTRLSELLAKRKIERNKILGKYLADAGSSLLKLYKENSELTVALYSKVIHFKERRLNIMGKIPIYIDLHSYLHIFFRHVKEMKFNKYYANRDNFQWDEEDVITVMQKVIEKADDEIQRYFNEHPDKRFGRWGRYSYYFEGDYYTIHIESTGRIDTFYKNKKEHEK